MSWDDSEDLGFSVSIVFGVKEIVGFGFKTAAAAQEFAERLIYLLRAS